MTYNKSNYIHLGCFDTKKGILFVISNVPILEIGTFKDDACDKIS